MSNIIFNINSKEVADLTLRLEKLNRSAMPLAVRGALNEAAFQMKNRYLPNEFKSNFTIRRPTFIKAHSGFNRCANTFDIKSMFSESGTIKGKSIAGDRLVLQETGGTLRDRNIPYADGGVSPTRISQNASSKQSALYFYKKFKNKPNGIINKTKQKTTIKTDKGLFEIKAGGDWSTLYLTRSTARIKPKRFIEPSGDMTAKLIPKYFYKEAQKRFKKALAK
jgi:hypothetical protein